MRKLIVTAAVSLALGGLPNVIDNEGAALAAGSQEAYAPVESVRGSELSRSWRSTGLGPNAASIAASLRVLGRDATRTISSAGFAGSNLRRGDSWRLRGGDSPFADYALASPDSEVGKSGSITGQFTEFDDSPDDPLDTMYMTMGLGGASYEAGYSAVTGDLALGADLQMLRLRVDYVDQDGSDFFPLVVHIKESGVIRYTWQLSVQGGAIRIYSFPFDWEAFASPSFSGISVELVKPNTAPALDEILVYAAEFTLDHSLPGADTKWLRVGADTPPVAFGKLALEYLYPGLAPRTSAVHTFLTEDGTAVEEHDYRYWRIDFRATDHPDGYVELGRFVAGPSAILKVLGDPKWGIEDTTAVDEAEDGAEYVEGGTSRVTVELDIQQPLGEALGLTLDGLFRQVGPKRPVIFDLLPTEAREGYRATRFVGRLVLDGSRRTVTLTGGFGADSDRTARTSIKVREL